MILAQTLAGVLLFTSVGVDLPKSATAKAPDPGRRWLRTLGRHFLEASAKSSLPHTESQDMLAAVMKGSMMGPGDGWFKPGRSRFDWKWLVGRDDPDGEGPITRAKFSGPADLFARLDRDGDGTITAADFDWTDKSPFLAQLRSLNPWYYRLDVDSNGRISRLEWLALFEQAAKGKDHLTPEDLRLALMPPAPPQTAKGPKGAKGPPKGMPSQKTLVEGLFKNELGSPFEGPRPGKYAPDFTLEKFDGSGSLTLSKLLGEKPVVLIFGSFS